MRNSLTFVLLWVSAMAASAYSRIYSETVKTATAIVGDDWLQQPVIRLGTDDVMTVGFDELSHNFSRMTYHLEHCEPDWTTTESLFDSDWLEGFNDIVIDNYETSVNTTVDFIHYSLQIPNDRCRIKMSGNYRLTVNNADGEKMLDIEFMVTEQLLPVSMTVTTNTDIGHNRSHQQVDLTVNTSKLQITDPDNQLTAVVMQNWDRQNARSGIQPSFHTPVGLEWRHQKMFIFDAGNEYHKFEVLDVTHPTMGIENIVWDGEHFQVYPYPASPRPNYLTDVDADGAFLVRNSERSETDITCDYVIVNYRLNAPWCGDIFIDGHWTSDNDRSAYKMTYNEEEHCYTCQLLQKQGYYSYRFTDASGQTAPTEGNFFQTENRYQTMVYYKGNADRTWRLVGFQNVTYNKFAE